ncbi:MAG: hypothetical protein M9894_30240 [Planctomycetes bacterium]|nr:hypothetical protein [Planctomycetota bacterium]
MTDPGAPPPHDPAARRPPPEPPFEVVVRRGVAQGPVPGGLGSSWRLWAIVVTLAASGGVAYYVQRPPRPPSPHEEPSAEARRAIHASPVVTTYGPAAEGGDATAMLVLGRHFTNQEHGLYQADLPTASRWFERAAAEGGPEQRAEAKLALFHLHEACCGGKAAAWLEEAAAAGHPDALDLVRRRAGGGAEAPTGGIDSLVSTLDALADELEGLFRAHHDATQANVAFLGTDGALAARFADEAHDQVRGRLLPAARVAELAAAAEQGDADARRLLLDELAARERAVGDLRRLLQRMAAELEEAERRGR